MTSSASDTWRRTWTPTDWLAARARLKKAKERYDDAAAPGRVLVICGSDRNDGTCPGEISKSFRLSTLIAEVRDEAKLDPDLLDLSLVTSEYGRQIHPCKGCVSTAMPLSVANAVRALRAGTLVVPDAKLDRPRPK